MSDLKIELPNLEYFTFKNPFTGSKNHLFNYKVTPGEGLNVIVWYGKYCSSRTEPAATESFPLDEEGLSALNGWLAEQYRLFEKTQDAP